MALFKQEITCLCCGGQYVRAKHECPFGQDLCQGKDPDDKHFDFCRRCRALLQTSFDKQMSPPKLLPKPRLRIEGET